MKKVVILLDSENNRHMADKVIEVLDRYSIAHATEAICPYKQPANLREYVKGSDADVFICISGLAGALPGIVASITPRPVIGVPVDQKLLGLDALLAMTQLPAGAPVATVGIDNPKNAAYLALRILALRYPEILTHVHTSQSSYGNYESHSQQPMSQSQYAYNEARNETRQASDYSFNDPEQKEDQTFSTPIAMPDFMLGSSKTADTAGLGARRGDPALERRRAKARGDWWM